ncbi:hypothetical protein FG91_03096 [Sphingopyxis sp. LC81]|uniref:hypothetical protein n=1 Tax=Sphingopyxis sp. LC81 TaxID=1502850 RepID=UPI00050E6A85|nr:hypothetical protein [Sphingopyxis sp. LC81]KGB52918.1 hypothetical protein FG91_03096 [Sphingopyxis sp. LC81]
MTRYRWDMAFNPPGFRTVILLALGFGLKTLSNVLERAGDLASDPGTRLFNHVSALAVLIAAAACFIWALKLMFFDKPRERNQAEATPEEALKHSDIYPDEANFDPDAALARYMTNRTGADLDDLPAPKPGRFGRKGL